MNTIDWLTRLVAYDTTSRNSNLPLIHEIQTWLVHHQITSRLTQDANEEKANLLAILPASDGNLEGGLLFSGHTDVVPVDGQQWNTHPFAATIVEEKMVGRGTCDMKGFLAVLLALMPEFQALRLKHPLYFAFSYDEEIGCRGAPLLIADMQSAGIKPHACIVGEPTNMRPVVAHKGIHVFRCRVQGQAAHSSLTPQGCNAIEHAAQLITYIRKLADQFKQEGPFDSHYDVPFTSISTNMIQGGIAQNTIPATCEFVFEFRHLPSVKPNSIIDQIKQYIKNELQPMMQQEQRNVAIEIDALASAPSFETNEQEAINQLVRAVTQDKEIKKVSYATEAGLFNQAHIPTIVCGPGSIEQAHRANEFVKLEQLSQCEMFLRQMVKQFMI